MFHVTNEFVAYVKLYCQKFKNNIRDNDKSININSSLTLTLNIKDYIDIPNDILDIIIQYLTEIIFFESFVEYRCMIYTCDSIVYVRTARFINKKKIDKTLRWNFTRLRTSQSIVFNKKLDSEMTYTDYNISSFTICAGVNEDWFGTGLTITFNPQLNIRLDVKNKLEKILHKYQFKKDNYHTYEHEIYEYMHKYHPSDNNGGNISKRKENHINYHRDGYEPINYKLTVSTPQTDIFRIIVFFYNLVMNNLKN